MKSIICHYKFLQKTNCKLQDLGKNKINTEYQRFVFEKKNHDVLTNAQSNKNVTLKYVITCLHTNRGEVKLFLMPQSPSPVLLKKMYPPGRHSCSLVTHSLA